MLQDYPIKNGSRTEIVLYLCDLHNKVNKRLSKPIFDCQKAFDFWGGNCGCAADKDGKDGPQLQNNSTLTNMTISSNETISSNVTQINQTASTSQGKDRISITYHSNLQ
jgi:hypothetical protein